MSEDPSNIPCEYMQALSSVAMGQFYDGVKIATKVSHEGKEIYFQGK